MRALRRSRTLIVLCLVALVGGCDSGGSGESPPDTADASRGPYYVALGDSYVTGAVRSDAGLRATTEEGFAYLVPGLAKGRGRQLELVNFGCGGATIRSILFTRGCRRPAVGGPRYREVSQVDAAARFIRQHREEVDLVTVLVGGNEINACAAQPDFVGCVANSAGLMERNLQLLMDDVRAAVDDETVVVGLTYPDIFLGAWVWPGIDRTRVERSIEVFRAVFNPMLKRVYEGAGARFIDVTAATGAYEPLAETVELAPYGVVPRAVARVCTLTTYCRYRDVHGTPEGYRTIADQVVAAFVG